MNDKQTRLGLAILSLLLALAPALSAGTSTPKTREAMEASLAAHQGDFDYLLGDWEFTAVRREEEGDLRFRGYWSAVRVGEGAKILDEYRVVSDSGETYYLSTTLRAFNSRDDRWELVSADAGTGLLNTGTGRREGAEVHIEQAFDATDPKPSLWRIRYYDIHPDRFRWSGDRSLDGGKTWVKGFMVMEVRRIGPARTLEPLTTVKAPAKPSGAE